jgi:hypothetical protein
VTVDAHRLGGHVPLDLRLATVDPERLEATGALVRSLEHGVPRIARCRRDSGRPQRGGDVLAHGVILGAMHAAFALLDVDGVVWKVPVHDPVGVQMEVQALLADGRRCQDEGPERGVKGLADRVDPVHGLLVLAMSLVETQRESAAKGDRLRADRADGCDISGGQRCGLQVPGEAVVEHGAPEDLRIPCLDP